MCSRSGSAAAAASGSVCLSAKEGTALPWARLRDLQKSGMVN